MGYKDAEWAYSLDRPLAETAVLAALCHRTDDKTHETFVGQQTVAEMLGSSPEKVMRSLKALEQSGVITRTRRNDTRGYRTSDLIRLNVDTYQPERLVGDSPTRQNSYQENRRDLTDFSSSPTRRKVTAEINQRDQPEDQPDLLRAFERGWAVWPKKVDRKKSFAKFERLVKSGKRDLDELVVDIIKFGNAYAATTEKQFTPGLGVWLNGERWEDELPQQPIPSEDEWQAALAGKQPAQPGRLTPMERAQRTIDAGRSVAQGRESQTLALIQTLRDEEAPASRAGSHERHDCESEGRQHVWLGETCNLCTTLRTDYLATRDSIPAKETS